MMKSFEKRVDQTNATFQGLEGLWVKLFRGKFNIPHKKKILFISYNHNLKNNNTKT